MNLDSYVETISNYLSNNPMSETELIMFVYIDLAKRFKFDPEFFFSNKRTKSYIYNSAYNLSVLNKCMENNTIICKSSSKILEYVLSRLGVKIRTITDPTDLKYYKHVFNIITPKDGGPEYIIDLQDDISDIRYKCFPRNFGLDFITRNYVIPRQEQRMLHEKVGYIRPGEHYMNEYLDLFRLHMDEDMPLYERIDLVLNNIEPYHLDNVEYWERRWQHERFLAELFDEREIKNKLHQVEFYTEEDGVIKNNNGFFIHTKDGVFVYYYNEEEFKYDKYDLHTFAKKVLDEHIHYRQGILDIRHHFNLIKQENEFTCKQKGTL